MYPIYYTVEQKNLQTVLFTVLFNFLNTYSISAFLSNASIPLTLGYFTITWMELAYE